MLEVCPSPAAAQTRAGVVRVEWPAANVLVYPDTMTGVTMWMATNAHAKVGSRPVVREIVDHFHPDSLRDWIFYTRQLIALREPIPGDTAPMVSSGIVRGSNGTSVAAARWRKKNKLEPTNRLVIATPNEEPLLFDLERAELDTLLDAFEASLVNSRWNESLLARAAPPPESSGRFTPVSLLSSAFHPIYPEERRYKNGEGEVWVTFTVGRDGLVDPASILIYLSDHSAFERSVRDFLRDVRFKPATADGQPVKMLTQQRFVFSIKRR